MNRLAVIGHPVAHSLSPVMHTAAFAALGLEEEWTYEAIDLAPEEFSAGVDELWGSGFVGVNVTVPHKEAAFALADRRSDAVQEIGAANTLSFDEKGMVADNTDASGLIAALPIGFDPARGRGRWCSAPAVRPDRRPGRSPGSGPRSRWPTGPQERAVQLADELGVAALRRPIVASCWTWRASICSSTPPRSALQGRVRSRAPAVPT